MNAEERHGAFSRGFAPNRDFDFDIRCVIGQSFSGAADVGEVLAAVEHVGAKDHDGWFSAWWELGSRVFANAEGSAAGDHQASAAAGYLRAATYLGAATNAIASLRATDRLIPTYQAHRSAWEHFVDTTAVPVERVAIPYETRTLPGYFFRPADDGQARATLIMVNGSDAPVSAQWGNGGYGALTRGYNVLMFDGPGQGSMLFEEGTAFRYDWEAVITPVVDFLLRRSDVDPKRIAMYGVSQAGFWVPRALAFEHRIAAAVADPGVVDVSASWIAHLPKSMVKLLDNGESEKFDKEMAFGMKFSGDAERAWNFRARPYQQDGYFATLAAVKRLTLGDEVADITTPLLITSPEDEQFWPGQSKRLAEMTSKVSTLVEFTAAEGANFHCEPLARALVDQRMFDWLDERMAPQRT